MLASRGYECLYYSIKASWRTSFPHFHRLPRSPSPKLFNQRHSLSSPITTTTITLCQAAASPDATPLSTKNSFWPELTLKLVSLSPAVFAYMFIPQILKNAANLSTSNLTALSGLSWMSYLTGLVGNTLLLNYFASKGEKAAMTVQGLGITSSYVVITQIALGGFMPSFVHSVVTTVVAIEFLLLGIYLSSNSHNNNLLSSMFNLWVKILGLGGLAFVAQSLFISFFGGGGGGAGSLWPAAATLVCGIALVVAELLNKIPQPLDNMKTTCSRRGNNNNANSTGLWVQISAWTATALFMLQPIVQLIKNFSDPSSLGGLSLATIMLAAVGNGLMIPRALLTGDVVWLTGGVWGLMVFGWGQLLSLYLAGNGSGSEYLSLKAFGVLTVVIWGWIAYVFKQNSMYNQNV
jgi:hypothetical protein